MTKSAFNWWLPSMLLIAVTVIAQSCYYDNKAENYGSSACDSANPTYTANIQPIINQNCIGCHGSNGPSGGVSLHTYDLVKIPSPQRQFEWYDEKNQSLQFDASRWQIE